MSNGITYLCQGKRQSVAEIRASLTQRAADLQKRHDAAAKDARAPLTKKLAELATETKALAKRADDELLGRKGCGANLTAQIEAIPDDGEVYEYTCPKCGNTGTVRKAVPELSAKPSA